MDEDICIIYDGVVIHNVLHLSTIKTALIIYINYTFLYCTWHSDFTIMHNIIYIYIHQVWAYNWATWHQRPVDLVAQLVEQCTVNCRDHGSNPVQAWISLAFLAAAEVAMKKLLWS